MKNLKRLKAWGHFCGIDQNGIKGLDLIELDITDNPKITDVSFMKNLKKLIAEGPLCGINNNSIKGLNLCTLNVLSNLNFKDTN